jgi:hypothetical protein
MVSSMLLATSVAQVRVRTPSGSASASGRGGAIASSSAAGGASTTKRQLAYKLPKWMKLAKNRGELFKTIERLRATL